MGGSASKSSSGPLCAWPQCEAVISQTRDLVPGIRERMLRWILSEAKKGTKSIGFVPSEGLERASAAGLVLIDIENDDPVAFMVWGPGRKRQVLRIYQAWTRADARRMTRAAALVESLRATAERQAFVELMCWCAADLESTAFWEALGFAKKAARLGGGRRIHYRYSKPVKIDGLLPGFSLESAGPVQTSERPSLLRQVRVGGRASPEQSQRRFL